jgi:hypothetical protein
VNVTFAADVPPPPGDLGDQVRLKAASPRAWSLEVRGALGPVVARLAGLPVSDVDVREPRLEDIVVRYYRGDA